jgi:hypothetical protein
MTPAQFVSSLLPHPPQLRPRGYPHPMALPPLTGTTTLVWGLAGLMSPP